MFLHLSKKRPFQNSGVDIDQVHPSPPLGYASGLNNSDCLHQHAREAGTYCKLK